jgi:hypothetical protein
MEEALPAGGNVLVYARVRDPDARDRLRHLLEDLTGERVNNALYEVATDDWDDGLWDREVERMREFVDPDTDTLIYWQVVGNKLVRTCIAGRFS